MEPKPLKISDNIKDKREKFRVEIKKERDNGIFNSKRIKFSPNPQNSLLEETKESPSINSEPLPTKVVLKTLYQPFY